MDRLFLDANILFSVAYRQDAGLVRLWRLDEAELVTSVHALEEARRNLSGHEQQKRLDRLLEKVMVLESQSENDNLPPDIELPDKDKPILSAAIHTRATHLITGDFRHFGKYYGKSVEGALILPPVLYLADF